MAQESFGFRRPGFSPGFVVTHVSILSSRTSRTPYRYPFDGGWNALLPLHTPEGGRAIRSFGGRLKPRCIFGADSLDQ